MARLSVTIKDECKVLTCKAYFKRMLPFKNGSTEIVSGKFSKLFSILFNDCSIRVHTACSILLLVCIYI